MTHQLTMSKTTAPRWSWLCRIGALVALITGLLLLMGMISLIITILQPGSASGWLLWFQNNWLVKIFILHAGFNAIQADLHGLNLLDMVILLFVSLICLSLSTAFRNAAKVWSFVAFALSLAAIILFTVTQIAGRSTVMLAVLINSFLMLRDRALSISKGTIYAGILAAIFLFAGDFTVGTHSNIITILFGIGYVLLIAWFFLIAPNLFRLDRAR